MAWEELGKSSVVLSGSNVEGTPGNVIPSKAIMIGGTDGTNLRPFYVPQNLGATGGDGWTMSISGLVTKSSMVNFNGATYDQVRNNTEGTLLASAARTSTTFSPDQTNFNARGVLVSLNITANPGNAETLQLELQVKDAVSGAFGGIGLTSTFSASNGAKRFMIYPGVSQTLTVSSLTTQALALPRTWRLAVVHSGAGSWTYSLSYQYIL